MSGDWIPNNLPFSVSIESIKPRRLSEAIALAVSAGERVSDLMMVDIETGKVSLAIDRITDRSDADNRLN